MLQEAKVAVVGDSGCGRTTLCHRMANAHYVPPAGGKAKHLDFYFAVGEVSPEEDSRNWLNLQSSILLKLVEPAGLDRSSLQSIIFRAVEGLLVLMDGALLFKEKMEGYAVDTSVTEMIAFWVNVVHTASEFAVSFPEASMPVFVVVSKVDLVPPSEQEAFIEECRLAVAQSTVVQKVFFTTFPAAAGRSGEDGVASLCEFMPSEPQEISNEMAKLISKLPRRTVSKVTMPDGNTGKRRCCHS
jgi:GTPase SAR1 family protein